MSDSTQSSKSYPTFMTMFMSQIVTLSSVKWPFRHLDSPSYYGLKNCQTTRIQVPPSPSESRPPGQDHSLGAWVMGPLKQEEDQAPAMEGVDHPEFRFPAGSTIFLYLHGNCETRSQAHRVKLCQILQESGYHVLSLDYRGYGDSTPRSLYPNEPSMTADAVAAFDWVSARVEPGTNTKIVVNGHSLGTGVSCALARALKEQGRETLPDGYLLLAPFNNIVDEVTRGFSWSAYFGSFVVDVPALINASKVGFPSDRNILSVPKNVPVMIMHAEDDPTVPYPLGKELYEGARSSGLSIEIISYPAGEGIKHDFFVKDPELKEKIAAFVQKVRKE